MSAFVAKSGVLFGCHLHSLLLLKVIVLKAFGLKVFLAVFVV
jgi:hypothetical protein